MSTREMFLGLRTRWFIVVAGLVAGVVLSLGYVTITPATYVATATSMVNVDASDDPLEMQAAASASRQLATSYVPLTTSSQILNPVIADLNLGITPEELAGHLTVTSPVTSGTISAVVKVSATAKSPEEAASLANAVIRSLESAIEKKSPNVEIDRFQTASPPTSASAPNKPVALALGAFLGLAAGVAAAIAYERRRGFIRRRDSGTMAVETLVLSDLVPSSGLGAEILALSSDKNNIFVLSSAGQTEVEPVAQRLALDILSLGWSVAVVGVDATHAADFGDDAVELAPLSTLLDRPDSADASEFAVTAARVSLVTVESREHQDRALMTNEAHKILERMGEVFDIVLVIAPPLNGEVTAIALSKASAGVLLLATEGVTRKRDYFAAASRLRVYGGKLAAAVILERA